MSISLFYWNTKNNVGDYYSYWLCSKIFNNTTISWSGYNADLASTGSILASNAISEKTLICGSGWHNCWDGEKFHGKTGNILGVRGKLTADYFKLDKNKVCLGDPGLLISNYYNKEVAVTNTIGLICHWKDIEYFKKLNLSNIKLISTTTTDIEQFIDDVRSCRFIFSTSLHGIIFAHAYGIPAVHLEHERLESRDNFKFKDYYSVIGIEYKKLIYSDTFSFKKEFCNINNFSDYRPTKQKLAEIKKNLSAMFEMAKSKLLVEHSTKHIKTCLCAIAKNENKYLYDWVTWYRNLGFDKIFLYDNNDVDGEHFDSAIGNYIKSGFVQVINVRGKSNQQIACYDKCYHTLAKNFDYIAFFDIDEFLNLTTSNSISEFLSKPGFAKFDAIAINWKYFDDNNRLYYENIPIYNRLTNEFIEPDWKYAQHRFSKRIVRTNLVNLQVNSSHGPIIAAQMSEYKGKDNSNKIIVCNSVGKEIYNNLCFENWTHNNAYLAHYRFKTLEEYITNKMKKGYPTLYRNSGKDLNLKDFFDYNIITTDKLQLAAKLLDKTVTDLKEQYNITNKLINNSTLKNITREDQNKIKRDQSCGKAGYFLAF